MKNQCLLILFILSSFVSCEFLDEQPISQLAPGNFYQSEEDAIAAVTAVYSHLQSGDYLSNDFWNLSEVSTDLLEPGASPPDSRIALQTYTFDPTLPNVAGIWQELYRGINRANTAIERIPGINMDEELRGRLVAEAQFLRALYYFDLGRVFGDVPLVLTETVGLSDLNVNRTSVEEVFDQVVADLQAAENILPESYGNANAGRATSGAAKALLTRVYLYRQNFSAAAQKAEEVVNAGTYALFENYADVWKVENENQTEHIFSVQFAAGIAGSGFPRIFGVNGAQNPINGFSGVFVEEDFLNSFDPNDTRRDASIRTSFLFENGDTATFAPHVWKYFAPSNGNLVDTDVNWPVIRYSDVLLMYAEALNESNSSPNQAAYDALNEVRGRAGLDPLDGLSQEEFRQAVYTERALELCFEGHRWFDLKRTNRLFDTITAYGENIQPRHALFPVPQRELDTNPNLTQNTGY